MRGDSASENDQTPEEGHSPKLLRPADLPDNFTRSLYKIAPYRGCGHGCRYCDGRAERYYVPGDFERDIEIRRTVPDRLERELPRIRERGMIGFGSGVTDPYQPIETVEELTGRCASILATSPQPLPAMVMTKSSLPMRDLPAWSRLNERAGFILLVSITSLDETLRERMEPGASCFASRIETLRAFKKAGCATGALVMPLLPGLSDNTESIQRVYSACIDAGVDFIMPGGLTLRPGRQKACYAEALAQFYPDQVGLTHDLYHEERQSGMPTRQAGRALYIKTKQIQQDHNIPFLLPHKIYANFLPHHDGLRILFRDMVELYSERGIDTEPLMQSSERYDNWLVSLRRVFRRRRSLPNEWLEERLFQALRSNELAKVLSNSKLAAFVSSILTDGVRLNYVSLKLE